MRALEPAPECRSWRQRREHESDSMDSSRPVWPMELRVDCEPGSSGKLMGNQMRADVNDCRDHDSCEFPSGTQSNCCRCPWLSPSWCRNGEQSHRAGDDGRRDRQPTDNERELPRAASSATSMNEPRATSGVIEARLMDGRTNSAFQRPGQVGAGAKLKCWPSSATFQETTFPFRCNEEKRPVEMVKLKQSCRQEGREREDCESAAAAAAATTKRRQQKQQNSKPLQALGQTVLLLALVAAAGRALAPFASGPFAACSAQELRAASGNQQAAQATNSQPQTASGPGKCKWKFCELNR